MPVKDDRHLSWSGMPSSLRAMVVLVMLEVVFLGVALYLGVGGDGRGRAGGLIRDILGRGEIRSGVWLRVAWAMPLVIAVTLFVAWQMGERFVAERDAGEGE